MRKIVQIIGEHTVVALCDDNTVWGINSDHDWWRYPDIPQDNPVEAVVAPVAQHIRPGSDKCRACCGDGGWYDCGWWYECKHCKKESK